MMGAMLNALRNRHFLLIDLLAFCLAPIAAVWLRTDGLDNVSGFDYVMVYVNSLALYALVACIVRWLIFIPLGLYSRYWRYASVDEANQIVFAVAVSTVLIGLIFLGILKPFALVHKDFPRSLPLLDGLLVLMAVGGSRFSVRLIERSRQRQQKQMVNRARVVIFGAGAAGSLIVREMQANPQLGLEPVGFIDSDDYKHGMRINGVPVLGDRDCLPKVVGDYRIQQAVIAIPTAPGKTIRELTRLCGELNLPVKIMPGMFELLAGDVTVQQLRPVEIDDLLRRTPVALEMTRVKDVLRGKCILITGAGGSIGSELCRQIARCEPDTVVLLGHGENSLFYTYNELHASFPQIQFRVVVADIRDWPRLSNVFDQWKPQVVFHAAAHKHVPLMEKNVEDAITNNILGTRNLVRLASAGNVDHFVLISSDKAVNPTSVMGVTKRMAELIVHDAAQKSGRCFIAVRFGNVLGSRGSVVPVFKKQIAAGGPITITHPDVRRYFMTIPEAVQLVLHAMTLGGGGEIFVLDMGEPILIVDLARDMIRLSGLEEGRDIDIEFIGLHPGEKLFEELFVDGEDYVRTTYEKIMVAHRASAGAVRADLETQVDALIAAAQSGDAAQARRILTNTVPEYTSSSAMPA